MFVGFLSTFTSGWPSSSSFVVVVYLDRARPLSSLLLFTVTPLFWGGSSLPSDSRLRSASFLFILTGYGRRSRVFPNWFCCASSVYLRNLWLWRRRRRRGCSIEEGYQLLSPGASLSPTFRVRSPTVNRSCTQSNRLLVVMFATQFFIVNKKFLLFSYCLALWRLPSSKLVKLGLVCWWGTLYYSKKTDRLVKTPLAGVVMHLL